MAITSEKLFDLILNNQDLQQLPDLGDLVSAIADLAKHEGDIELAREHMAVHHRSPATAFDGGMQGIAN